jgi:hypothetical protein
MGYMDSEEGLEVSATEITITDTENEKVQRWRAEALERAGYDPTTAAVLAERTDVDLHAATALIERGCTPELALRILL